MFDNLKTDISNTKLPDIRSDINLKFGQVADALTELNRLKLDLNMTNGGDLTSITNITDMYTYYLTDEGDDSKYVRIKSIVYLPYTHDGSGIPDMDYFEEISGEIIRNKIIDTIADAWKCKRLPIKHGTGLMDFEITNGENVVWLLSDGSISYEARPAKTLPAGTSYLYASNLWSNTVELRDQTTDSNYLGDLSSVSNLTYWLSLYNCINITGDLSSVSNLTYWLSLYNCTNITGDLSSVSNLTYLLSLYNCTNITGDLSSVSNLTYYLGLYNCTNITGILNPTATIKRIYLSGTGMSANDTDQTLINLRNNTTITSDGILQINANRTTASDDAYNYLTTNGWTITEI